MQEAEQDREKREKQRQLFLQQKALLDTFLAHGTITRAQYDKSYGDLKIKMGFEEDGAETR